MALFISYSSQDRPGADALTAALRHGRQEVWFDQQLGVLVADKRPVG